MRQSFNRLELNVVFPSWWGNCFQCNSCFQNRNQLQQQQDKKTQSYLFWLVGFHVYISIQTWNLLSEHSSYICYDNNNNNDNNLDDEGTNNNDIWVTAIVSSKISMREHYSALNMRNKGSKLLTSCLETYAMFVMFTISRIIHGRWSGFPQTR